MAEFKSNQPARLAELESRYEIMARTVEELDAIVVVQAKEIEQMRRQIAVLTSQLASIAPPTGAHGLEYEKPPHY